ncbi:mitochondrial pyruvate carrier 2-like [Lucilia cuprina]|uniref:mitochondrial pyruvate carrier 2-like n=1 Tax=Lucilia cuprina TaxID=7375 RepID=UPI000C7190CB|nr:mitochondrial pyruvate carrier 2-like [Lucilia cuprina]
MVRFLTSAYNAVIGACDKIVPASLRPLWMSPAGPKTVFFWAPVFKWGLVIAGIGDLKRPAEFLSINQASTLTATGLIWSRYSMVIVPKNYILLTVNMFVALTQGIQVVRAVKYQMEQNKEN